MRTLSYLIGILLLLSVFVAPAPLVAQDGRASGDADFSKRLQRLEEQIVDLSAQLGAVESLARNSSAGAGNHSGGQPQGDPGMGDESRLGRLENEVRALSAQMSDLLQRLQRLEGRQGIISPSQQPGQKKKHASDGVRPAEEGTGFSVGGNDNHNNDSFNSGYNRSHGTSNNGYSNNGYSSSPPQRRQQPEQPPKKKEKGLFDWFSSDEPEKKPVQRYGSANTPSQPRRRIATNSAPPRYSNQSSGQAKTLYDRAYANLMRRNYRAAKKGFEEFVQSFPSDPHAGKAHFWLGEVLFTSGEYRKAADSFLKCATNFPKSEKAPESLFKLGISLKRLNEKEAACSTFSELAQRFPDAQRLLKRAEIEKRRTGC
jgi:tol-pal system protein YbgF